MVTNLQFVAIAAFLIWCLVSSLCGMFDVDAEPARLVWREHGQGGWGNWREAHFGLTAADRRVLSQPESALDAKACATLLDTVLQQARHPDSDAVQFAVVRMPPDEGTTVVFVSDSMPVASSVKTP
jgi:hypothetical protein